MSDRLHRLRSWSADGLDRLSRAVRPRPLYCGMPLDGVRVVRMDQEHFDDVRQVALSQIEDAFACDDDCPRCDGTGAVCERHTDRPHGACDCGGAMGVPCDPERRGRDDSAIGGRPVRADLTMTLCDSHDGKDDDVFLRNARRPHIVGPAMTVPAEIAYRLTVAARKVGEADDWRERRDRLIVEAIAAGGTQAEVAKLAGVTQPAVSQIIARGAS